MSFLVEDLRVGAGAFLVQVPRLEVEPGQIHVLIGRSGSGKTTLLQGLAGFLPTQGALVLAGRHLEALPPERRRIALVFQRSSLFPHLSALQNVAFGLALQGLGKRERRERAMEWLEKLGLAGLSRRLPQELSEGQAQRVALARALAPAFPVLLLDEPFAALDPATRRELYPLLRKLVEERQVHALFVSHQPEDALALASRISLLEEGMLRWTGTLEEARVDARFAGFFGSGPE